MGLLNWIFGSRKKSPPAPSVGPAAFAVLDVETTGLSPTDDRVIELAVVRVDASGGIVDSWSSRFNPERPMGASNIHGITDADVGHAPRFREAAADIASRLDGLVLVAHNAPFDLAFLRSEFTRAGHVAPHLPSYCTLKGSRHYFPHLAQRRLADCCTAAAVTIQGAHSALGDALATAALLRFYLAQDARADLIHPLTATSAIGSSASSDANTERARAAVLLDRRLANVGPTLVEQALALDPDRLRVGGDASPEMVEYISHLRRTLRDHGFIPNAERMALEDLAEASEISFSEVLEIRKALLAGLAAFVATFGQVTRREREKLRFIGFQLDLDQVMCDNALKDAEVERSIRLNESTRPLPAGWRHGEPLRIGDRVAFTGDTGPEGRAAQEADAARRGLRVTSTVSSRTALLVWDGVFQGNKYASAREHNTRVVSPEDYYVLLKYIQPSRAEGGAPRVAAAKPPLASDSPSSYTPPPSAGEKGHDASAIRAWGRENGFVVADRGRLSAGLVEKYWEAQSR